MRHLSIAINPREAGMKPYCVSFHRPESVPVRSIRDEGLRYRHPERRENVTVWAENEDAVAEVLTYHYGSDWDDLQRLPDKQNRGR